MRVLIFGLMLLLLSACSVKRKLAADQQLYGGSQLVLENTAETGHAGRLKEELADILQPVPNTRILGGYWPLWWHFRAQNPRSGKLAAYINKKFGEAPVLFEAVDQEKSLRLLQNRLENKGYFDVTIESSTFDRGNRRYLQYRITLPVPYRLRNYKLLPDSSQFGYDLTALMPASLLQTGQRYELDRLKDERVRIDRGLKQLGYYQFNAEYLLFRMDTTVGDRQFDLYLSTKKASPPEATKVYRIGEITIFPNFSLQTDSTVNRDTTLYAGIHFVDQGVSFKPKYLQPYLQFKPGDLYRIQDQESSLNRFSAIGNFRYVQLQYSQPDSQDVANNILQAQLYLSPYNRRALNFEAQALAKSNNFVGPALLTTYTNRNLFKGGELFKLTAKLGFETQLAGGRSTGLFAYELGLQAELMVPRLVLPFESTPKTGYGIPKTRITLGGSSLNRVNLYRLNAAQLGYGFNWQKNRFVYQEFTPLNVSYTGLGQTGPAFDSILAANTFLQRSFDQRFIAGLTYLFQFSELNEPSKRHRFFTQLGIDLSGNALHWVQSAQGKAGTLFGEAYAHYARVDLDLRHYWQIKRNHRLVSRVFAAYGQPLGATSSLPYIKQFFSGGPNSVRAFRIRSLGPGTYRPASVDLQSFFDQAGDIKLEFNLEYRFPLGGFLQGALFADAGNVWLANENPALPGSGFSTQALSQLAVGTGFGLRIDVSLLVLRFDLAMPVRKPWLASGSWFDYSTSPGNSWASEHLILNFGIGYPF